MSLKRHIYSNPVSKRTLKTVTAKSKEWISASRTRNYMLKDPLLDWLKLHWNGQRKRKVSSFHDSKAIEEVSFTKYIMEMGKTFEKNVVKTLYSKFGKKNIECFNSEMVARRGPETSDARKEAQKLIDEMFKGTPIILSGMLINPETKTYGVPDMIVRSDWLNKITQCNVISVDEEKIPAPGINSKEYHYRIVDIKCSTIKLRATGRHILNYGSTPAFKSQLYIYNQALARVQGFNPSTAYIIGRKYEYTSKRKKKSFHNPLDRMGIISYNGIDGDIIHQTSEAIKWLRLIKTDEAKKWNPMSIEDCKKHPELFPNMSNSYDSPWHSVKLKIAEKIKELTSVWRVGVKQRTYANQKGVFKWSDKMCNAKSLGFVDSKTSEVTKTGEIVDAMLHINRSRHEIINPVTIKNSDMISRSTAGFELFVDFETIGSIMFDYSTQQSGIDMITMIGVGHLSEGKWKYKCFQVDNLSKEEEMRICLNYCEYIEYVSMMNGYSKARCYHWAPAEKICFDRALKRHKQLGIYNMSMDVVWNWFDLWKFFKLEPITINGCLNFGLKSVASAMKKHNLIESSWPQSSILDGPSAMVATWKTAIKARQLNTSMSKMPLMADVQKYNEIDVKVLCEILSYIRNNMI